MALVAGNTLVLKAAEDAPLGVLRIAEVCQRAPAAGRAERPHRARRGGGAALARHPLVRKLSFTGSTEVGKVVMRAAADRIVPVSLELGGKSPRSSSRMRNEDRVADGVIGGMRFTRQGQSCTAGSRLFLHASIFDSFLSALAKKPPS